MKSIKKKWSCASHCKLHFQKVLGIMIVALAFLLTGNANAQESKTIKGVVRDATGEPLIGASVIEKGTNNGVITDVEGSFILTVPTDATLSIAYMGYATREIRLAKRKKQGDLKVTLREDSQQLKEVVVTAMGIKKDTKRLGYAVSTIESDEIVKAGATNFASAMYGKAPGIRITQTQGGAAGAVSINVRGLTSITGNNQPLIILDGVPIRNGGTGKSTDFAEFGNDGQIRSNGLVDINPEDIESVSVLKGASATALYGSEAANGAVVITSKRAKSGKLTVDFTAQVTANLPAYLPKVQTVYGPGRYNTEYSDYEKQTGGFYQRTMNGESYKSLYSTTMSFGPKYDGSDVLYWDGKVRPYLPTTDNPWKELFRTGWNQTYNLAISQGTETSSNRFSYTFMDEMPNSLTGSFTKHNFKLTGSYKLAKPLTLEYSLNYIIQDVKNRPQTSLNLYGSFSNMFSSFMDIPYLKQSYVTSLGYRNTYAVGGDATLTPDEAWAYNPGYLNGVSNMLWNMYHHHSKETENRLIGMVRPTWQITNWLSLRAQLATDITDTKQTLEYETERPNSLYDPSGSFQSINRRYDIVYGDVMLNFNYNIRRFDIAATLGWTGRYENMNNMRVSTNGGLVTENWFDLNASRYTASSTLQRMELLKTGYMGTLSLGWDNYLFLELTGRQERSSTLKDKSFFYPSANLSFLFSNAFRMPAWWNHGKLRLSYGIVGNAPETYAANIIYEQGSDNGFTWNYVPSSWGNANIRPEKKYEYEIGLESKFLNNRLGFDVSYYNNRVKDQILSTPQPSSSGVKYVLMNVGEVANEGWDISVSATPVLTKNFRWDLTANYGIYRNKVVKLAEGVPYLEISNIGGGGAKIQAVEGRPMGDIYVQMPQMNENGDYLVSDKGLYLNQTDLQRVGNINPDGVGGLFSSFSYKNIFLDFSIDFRIGGDVINEMYQYSTASGLTPESLQYRDTEHGGLSYYYPGNNNASGTPVQVDPSSGAGPNGEIIYHDGIILPGVVASTGEKNTRIIPAGYYYNQTYNWGTQPEQLTYRHSVFDNTYVKLRELTIGYQFPEKLTAKLGMTRLSVSIFGRNLFYFYKALKNYDAESSVGTSWASQAVVGGSTTATRNFGVSLRASF
ncbi:MULTISPECIES: SusC/RagA family TonB-linked outer membrane protein [Bacteroides]|jgi:iron complex outermembrane receptor protein|uniref:SusC/RagA family TonB-linked outer membrane protein n=1 Tax=Bacteroides TaxID=816 RepID=UPI000E51E249|nr:MULTISPECIES: SusC/RagA family TonB-linked outer membrane protein [Bacteroides]MBU8971293.1 SusC/RagA family TonB-linked outer membrane protein [Bacteroides eggerthii]MBU8995370.1 SusC/RagA family TonB-linked outer membrane protein [Bacteroides eggerthii]MBU8995913.1 SusC/RagA family TonB-linked outer membrane protein [Bacteroides eggerthii]MCG4756823.1 SusC/RagA family TonB-linked outer membrane protein [Bacteroides eggerthii]MCG4757364.1 SusC/RagA family TonB-linked outer membrane protein